MKAKLLFQFLLFLCPLLLLTVSEAAIASPFNQTYPPAKPSCQDMCGDITIPFPFGIGAHCFLDEWYEILCDNSTPRLKKLGLQVLNISLSSNDEYRRSTPTVTVNYPIIHSSSSCTSTHVGIRDPMSLARSPFFFSPTDNVFVAVGCENTAILKGSNHSFVGCSTDCIGNNTRPRSSCDGYDCCHSTIPDGLQDFSVDFPGEKSSGTSGVDHDCQFAFLISSSWFEPNSIDLYAIRNGDYVQVVLRWGIVNDSFPMSIGLEKYSTGLPTDVFLYSRERGAVCEQIDDVNLNTTFMNCYCYGGFYGNPYIEDGCKDINECEITYDDGSKACSGLHKCRNTRGSHHCTKIYLYIIIGLCSSIGPLLLIFLAWWLYKVMKERKEANLKKKHFKRNGGLILQQQLSSPEGNVEKGKLFNSKELEIATDHFNKDRILGKGGQGTVYKGMLTDGRIVAIKKSLTIDEEDVEPFINEVVILSQINHRNVVKLLGCCLESEVPLLVYEFIPNGTLYQYLHDQEFPVKWEARLRIATEIASALFYLHSSASIPIYHRDIKSSNVLLDEKYRARIADFGTSRSVAIDQTHVTTLVQGTFGYLDPEYFQSSQFTNKSDVYSFGVVLVELLTGQKPVSSLRANEGRSLATYFIISMEENHLFDIFDAPIKEQGSEEEIIAVANLAKRCLNLKGRKRPSMKEVVMGLEGIRNPALRASRMDENPETESDHIEAEKHGVVSAFSAQGGSNTDAHVISLSDAHPLLPSESW